MTDQSTAETSPHDLEAFDASDGESPDFAVTDFEATEYVAVDSPDDPSAIDQRNGPVARYDERHHVLWIGSMPIPFRVGESRNAELLELLAATIRHLRGLDDDAPCPLRRSEHRLLAGLLDLSDPELRFDLRRHLGISRRQAGDTVAHFRRVLSDREIRLD